MSYCHTHMQQWETAAQTHSYSSCGWLLFTVICLAGGSCLFLGLFVAIVGCHCYSRDGPGWPGFGQDGTSMAIWPVERLTSLCDVTKWNIQVRIKPACPSCKFRNSNSHDKYRCNCHSQWNSNSKCKMQTATATATAASNIRIPV